MNGSVKDFVEVVKVYKEYIAIVGALLAGGIFVLNYFATKEALTDTQITLNRLVDERECWLNNRITISENALSIENLERERLEKTKRKIELTSMPKGSASPVEQVYKEEQLLEIAKDFQRIDEELKDLRARSRTASENLVNRTCMK